MLSLCQDESGSKLDGRGDSAVSKGTADSGVVIEDGLVPALPGEVPRKPPNLPSVFDKNRQDGEFVSYIKVCKKKKVPVNVMRAIFSLFLKLFYRHPAAVQQNPG